MPPFFRVQKVDKHACDVHLQGLRGYHPVRQRGGQPAQAHGAQRDGARCYAGGRNLNGVRAHFLFILEPKGDRFI